MIGDVPVAVIWYVYSLPAMALSRDGVVIAGAVASTDRNAAKFKSLSPDVVLNVPSNNVGLRLRPIVKSAEPRLLPAVTLTVLPVIVADAISDGVTSSVGAAGTCVANVAVLDGYVLSVMTSVPFGVSFRLVGSGRHATTILFADALS